MIDRRGQVWSIGAAAALVFDSTAELIVLVIGERETSVLHDAGFWTACSCLILYGDSEDLVRTVGSLLVFHERASDPWEACSDRRRIA